MLEVYISNHVISRLPQFSVMVSCKIRLQIGIEGTNSCCLGSVVRGLMNSSQWTRTSSSINSVPGGLLCTPPFTRMVMFSCCFTDLYRRFAHFYNFHVISTTPLEALQGLGLPFNAVPTVEDLTLKSIPGSTGSPPRPISRSDLYCLGVITIVIMVIMYFAAVDSIRRRFFEGFWLTHHLFILYYVLISIHGIAGK